MLCERESRNRKSNGLSRICPSCDPLPTRQNANTTYFRSNLIYSEKSYLNISLLSIILIGLLTAPFAASQRFDVEELDEDFTNDVIIPSLSNHTGHNDNSVEPKTSNSNFATPRIQAVKSGERDSKKCPKSIRHTYCFNKGTCNWIIALSEPSCHCKTDWKGKRCQERVVQFTSNNEASTSEEVIIIAVVVSLVVLAVIITTSCICWRRYINVKKELASHDLELAENEEEEKLTEKEHIHDSSNAVDA